MEKKHYCKVCNKEIYQNNTVPKNPTFMCRICFPKSEEGRYKNSEGVKRAYQEGRGTEIFYSPESLQRAIEGRKKGSIQYGLNKLQEILDNPNKYYSGTRLKNLLLNSNIEYECKLCGITDWGGLDITLEVDHKDGNKCNNSLENLRFLCPNCHSQTDTYKGKNIKKQGGILSVTVSDEELITAYNQKGSIRQALLQVGLNPAGANYYRLYELLSKEHLKNN